MKTQRVFDGNRTNNVYDAQRGEETNFTLDENLRSACLANLSNLGRCKCTVTQHHVPRSAAACFWLETSTMLLSTPSGEISPMCSSQSSERLQQWTTVLLVL